MWLVGTKHDSSALLTITHLNFRQSHWERVITNQVFKWWSQAQRWKTHCTWPCNKKKPKQDLEPSLTVPMSISQSPINSSKNRLLFFWHDQFQIWFRISILFYWIHCPSWCYSKVRSTISAPQISHSLSPSARSTMLNNCNAITKILLSWVVNPSKLNMLLSLPFKRLSLYFLAVFPP